VDLLIEAKKTHTRKGGLCEAALFPDSFPIFCRHCILRMVPHPYFPRPNSSARFVTGGQDVSYYRWLLRASRLSSLAEERIRANFGLADLYEQEYLAERSMQSDAVDVLAIYHCQPDGRTCMSDLDAQLAARWTCIDLVISLQASAKTVQVRGHQLIGRRLCEVELIRPDCSAVVFMETALPRMARGPSPGCGHRSIGS
jgi:proteasome lid subunit RPN8/RPN11